MSTIRFEQVVKQFPNAPRPSVDGISLEIPTGQFTVLLGPSGCGKTTLLKMVNRLYEPTSGQIVIDDQPIQTLNATLLRRKIGYVIQQIGLFPHMTVAENIATVPKLLSWDRARIDARTDELLELIDLPPAEYRGRYPAQMSGGQQQRVGLARAMAADPGVLLMDEPFGALDAITRTSLQDSLVHVQQQLKKTVLFVTHDVEEALRLADVIVVLRQGQIAQAASPATLLAHPADPFVAELVGAADVLRRLSVVRVSDVMHVGSDVSGPCIDADADVREALALLLAQGAETLRVERAGQPVGSLALKDIQTVFAQ